MPCSMYAIIYGNDMAISWHTLMVYMERGEGKSTNHQHHLIAQRVESPHPSVDRSTCNFKRRSHWNTVPGYTQFGSRYLRTKRMVAGGFRTYETREWSNGGQRTSESDGPGPLGMVLNKLCIASTPNLVLPAPKHDRHRGLPGRTAEKRPGVVPEGSM